MKPTFSDLLFMDLITPIYYLVKYVSYLSSDPIRVLHCPAKDILVLLVCYFNKPYIFTNFLFNYSFVNSKNIS